MIELTRQRLVERRADSVVFNPVPGEDQNRTSPMSDQWLLTTGYPNAVDARQEIPAVLRASFVVWEAAGSANSMGS